MATARAGEGLGLKLHDMGTATGIVIAGGLIGLIGIAQGTPSSSWLFGEDGVIEWASASIYLTAAALALLALCTRRAQVIDQLLMLFVAALGLACFLSEISFGARIFGFAMPAMAGGGELDGVQDFAMLAKRFFMTAPASHVSVILLVVGALAAVAIVLARRWSVVGKAWASLFADHARRLVTLAGVALVVSLLLDVFEQPRTRRLEEIAELFAAAILMAAMWWTNYSLPRPTSFWHGDLYGSHAS